jgi:hypothetical protein
MTTGTPSCGRIPRPCTDNTDRRWHGSDCASWLCAPTPHKKARNCVCTVDHANDGLIAAEVEEAQRICTAGVGGKQHEV